VREDPWDTEAWATILLEAQAKSIDVVRDVYEEFLKYYPTAVFSFLNLIRSGTLLEDVRRARIGPKELHKYRQYFRSMSRRLSQYRSLEVLRQLH
jgi:hypothetical protein